MADQKQARRGKILVQLIRPMVLFIIVLTLINAIFLFVQNLNTNLDERYSNTELLGQNVASEFQSFRGISFLIEYWKANGSNMDLVYDNDEALAAKEKALIAKYPDVTDVELVTREVAEAMDEEGQKLYAEISYCRLSRDLDTLKRVYSPFYLYTFQVVGDQMYILVTGTKVNERRISQGGDLFEVGVIYPYNVGDYPKLDEVLQTQKTANDMELSLNSNDNYLVHAFVPIFANGKMVAVCGVTTTWQDMIMSTLQPSIVVTVATITLFIVLGIAIYMLLKQYVVVPVDTEEAIIKKYKEDKDSEDAVNKLAGINSNNEITTLAEGFSSMIKEMDRYIEEIKTVTSEKERIGAELSMAASIQESQLPNTFPAFPNRKDIDIYASMNPAKEVGGDFYDFFMIDDDHIGFVMADVSGKGIPAALFMMISKILIKNHLQGGDDIETTLELVNNQLMESNEEGLFVTVWVATIELSTGKGIAANAGHEHPIVKRASGKFELVEYRHSPPVATFPGLKYKQHEFKLDPGDILFVYTDGLPEATDATKELYGSDRILETLNNASDVTPEGLIKEVTVSVDKFVGEAEQFDDLTVMAIKYYGPKKE